MSNFREMVPQWLQNGCSKKFQTLTLPDLGGVEPTPQKFFEHNFVKK